MKDLEDTAVYIEIDPSDVNYINRIIEGYEYLGILTTLDPKRDAKVTILPDRQSALPKE